MIAAAKTDLEAQANPDIRWRVSLPSATESHFARFRRQPGFYLRGRCPHRLSPDARHASRFQALRQQGQSALRSNGSNVRLSCLAGAVSGAAKLPHRLPSDLRLCALAEKQELFRQGRFKPPE